MAPRPIARLQLSYRPIDLNAECEPTYLNISRYRSVLYHRSPHQLRPSLVALTLVQPSLSLRLKVLAFTHLAHTKGSAFAAMRLLHEC